MHMELLWAKSDPFHSLLQHCIDAGAVAFELLSSPSFAKQVELLRQSTGVDSVECMEIWAAYIVALHDLGKCDRHFQSKHEELQARLEAELGPHAFAGANPNGFRHERRSGAWVKGHLASCDWGRRPALTIAAVLQGHHGDFGSGDHRLYEEEVIQRVWEPLRKSLAYELQQIFQPPQWSPQGFPDHSIAGLLLSGLVVMSDWIASNMDIYPVSDSDSELEPADYATISRQRAEEAIAKLGINDTLSFAGDARFSEIWNAPEFQQPRPLQTTVEKLCRNSRSAGLAIIEAPMGEGKTEAAVYLATQWMNRTHASGMYVALPTAATSNQMHGRIRNFLEQFDPRQAHNVRLVHGAAWLVDDATPADQNEDDNGYACEWFRPSKRALLAPYGVGTIDQALMSVLHVRFGFLRLFGLANNVLIIDEVHAYDAYMNTILTQLLRWCSCLDIPVILLSATLPSARKQALLRAYGGDDINPEAPTTIEEVYPLITTCDEGGHQQQVNDIATICSKSVLISKYDYLGDPAAIAALALHSIQDGGCLCIIANTVASAQAIYKEIGGIGLDGRFLLFHSRFTAGRRNEIENTVLSLFGKGAKNRPERAILVATQVVEQSLDLDFDVMISEIAPIDLLLQRAGRLHRHDRPQRPTGNEARLHVVVPREDSTIEFGPSGYVYNRFILLKTLSILRSLGEINIPDDMRGLIETVYNEDELPADTPAAQQELLNALEELRAEREGDSADASKYLIPAPYNRSFKLALQQQVWEESEGEASSYFYAQTRQGENTQTVLLLENNAFIDLLNQPHSPSRDMLKKIFLHQTKIPAWWLQDIEPAEGYHQPAEGPRWLRGVTLINLVDGRWCGIQQGNAYVIREDHDLGIVREEN